MSNSTTTLPNMPPRDPKAVRAHSLIGNNVFAIAAVSKLRHGNMVHHQSSSQNQLKGTTATSDIMKMSQEQQMRIIDGKNAVELMPEIEWACRVLVSSLLAPNNMTQRELVYNIGMDWLPPAVRASVIRVIEKDMEEVYDYNDSLYSIFRDCLFVQGSHPRLVIPESIVDRIINSGETLTMESLSKVFHSNKMIIRHGGWFGPRFRDVQDTRLTFENLTKPRQFENTDEDDFMSWKEEVVGEDGVKKEVIRNNELVTFSDSPDAIRVFGYKAAIEQAKREALLDLPKVDEEEFAWLDQSEAESTNESISTPNIGRDSQNQNGYITPEERSKHSKLTTREFEAATYKSAPNNIVTHLQIPGRAAAKRRSIGRPLVQSIPPEAIAVVHRPGNPRKPEGFIIIYDEMGSPLTLMNSEQIIARSAMTFNTANNGNAIGQGQAGSMILNKAARNLVGNTEVTTFQEGTQIHEQLLRENINARFMNGALPGGVEMTNLSDISAIMYSRTLCSMRTRMVFVPAEMMTYFAFDFHDNGQGKSLIDANKYIISLRAGMMVARALGEIRNSIPLTEVTVKVEDLDQDPEQTMEQVFDILSKTRSPAYPLATLQVNDIQQWINRAGMVVRFEDHPKLPDTKIMVEKSNHNNTLPSNEYNEYLGKLLYMGFGIPPEIMGQLDQQEFATAIASRNIMFTQTVLELQKRASSMITNDIIRLSVSDGIIVNAVTKVIKGAWGQIAEAIPEEEKAIYARNQKAYAAGLVTRVIEALNVGLPSPDTTTVENLYEDFQLRENVIDSVLKYIVSADVLPADMAPEGAARIEASAPAIKASFMRDWMAEHNFMPDLLKLVQLDESGKPMYDLDQRMTGSNRALMLNIVRYARKVTVLEQTTKTDSEKLGLGDPDALPPPSSGGSDTSSGGGGGAGMFDFGGLNFDEDLGGEEAAPPEAE